MHIRPYEADCGIRRVAVMNLALRGIEDDFGPEDADILYSDLHPAPRTDYVFTNPRFRKDNAVRFFSLSDSSRERAGVGCRNPSFPPKGSANFTWVQDLIHHLAPHLVVGLVLANGSMSSKQSIEGDILRYNSRTLVTPRDTLLPKLLSGELSVNELNVAES